MRDDWEHRRGQTEPTFASRRHDTGALFIAEALDVAWSAYYAKLRLSVRAIVAFLETWWPAERIVEAKRLAGEFAGEADFYSRSPEEQEASLAYDREAADLSQLYPPGEPESVPELGRALRYALAHRQVIYALEIQDYIFRVVEHGERGPVMAALEREASGLLRSAVATLKQIAQAQDERTDLRASATDILADLRPLDELEDPAIAVTWPHDRGQVAKRCDERHWQLKRSCLVPKPDSTPMPGSAVALYRRICDYRYDTGYVLNGDKDLRFAMADAVEDWDPALAMFLRLNSRGQWKDVKEPTFWFGNTVDSRFSIRVPGFGSAEVGGVSCFDVYRWVEPIGSLVKEVHFALGLIAGVTMTLDQLRDHGEKVMAAAPITYLELDCGNTEQAGLAEFLQSTPAFAPIRVLDLKGAAACIHNEAIVRAVFSNPHLSRVERVTFEFPSTNNPYHPPSMELTEFIAARSPSLPKLRAIGNTLAGGEVLVTTQALREERANAHDYPALDGYSSFILPPRTDLGHRFEYPERTQALFAKYGELPWLKGGKDEREGKLSKWWGHNPRHEYRGHVFWRDE